MKTPKKLSQLLRLRQIKTALLFLGTFVVLGTSGAAMHISQAAPPAKPAVSKINATSHHVKNLTKSSTPPKASAPVQKPPTTPAATPAPKLVAVPSPKPAANVAASPAAVANTGAAPGNGVSGLSSSSGSPAPATTTTPTASPSPSPSPAPSPSPCTNTPGHYASTNWAGYFKSDCIFTAVSGNWTAPISTTASTTDLTVDATWIGIGGVTTNDLIQVGTEETVDTDGTINAAVFYELLPDMPHYPAIITVSPGDQMSASIAETSPGTWFISISDLTNGKTFTKTVSYISSYSSVEWIEEDPSYNDGTLVPFDNFGTVTFTNASATGNGTPGTLSDASSIKLVDDQFRTLASPSPVGGGANDSFSITRLLVP